MCSIGLRRVSTAVSTENATIPKSTKLRTSDSSVYRGTHSNRDCFLIILFGIRTKECEFLDSVDFGGVAFLVESTMGAATCRRKKKFRGCSIKKISGVQHKKKFKKNFGGAAFFVESTMGAATRRWKKNLVWYQKRIPHVKQDT